MPARRESRTKHRAGDGRPGHSRGAAGVAESDRPQWASPLGGAPFFDSPGNSASLRVLLLNATHEPLAVVPGRRAVILILAGKAESVEDRLTLMHSAQLVIQMPAVVRLNRYVRIPYRAPTAVSRAGVLRRDGRRCAYCSGRGETVDHVVPRSRGGGHSWENCVACCGRCNTRKADRTLDELGWRLTFLPGAPSRMPTGGLWLNDDADPAWSRWLNGGTAA